MDKLEALAKVQDESGAKVELAEFGDIEHLVEEVELVEFGIKEVEEPRIDKLVVEESANKVELDFFAAKFEAEETRAAKDDPEFRAIKTKLQELRVLESNHEEEFGAEVELQMPAFGVLRFVGWVSRSLTM